LQLALPGWVVAQLALDTQHGESLGGPTGSDTQFNLHLAADLPRERLQALAKLQDQAVADWPDRLEFGLEATLRTPTVQLPAPSEGQFIVATLHAGCRNCDGVNLPFA